MFYDHWRWSAQAVILGAIPFKKMQRIHTKISPSEYVSERHMQFVIDDLALDRLLDEWYPDQGFLGMIPTTLNWLHSEPEQSVVWDRFLDRSKKSVLVPLLCCPDDLDFSCSLVIVETRIGDDTVEWRTFGFDTTQFDRLPHGVGKSANWLPARELLVFDRTEYDNVARQFHDWAQTQSSE